MPPNRIINWFNPAVFILAGFLGMYLIDFGCTVRNFLEMESFYFSEAAAGSSSSHHPHHHHANHSKHIHSEHSHFSQSAPLESGNEDHGCCKDITGVYFSMIQTESVSFELALVPSAPTIELGDNHCPFHLRESIEPLIEERQYSHPPPDIISLLQSYLI